MNFTKYLFVTFIAVKGAFLVAAGSDDHSEEAPRTPVRGGSPIVFLTSPYIRTPQRVAPVTPVDRRATLSPHQQETNGRQSLELINNCHNEEPTEASAALLQGRLDRLLAELTRLNGPNPEFELVRARIPTLAGRASFESILDHLYAAITNNQ